MAETTAPLWVPEHDYLPPEDRSVIRALRSAPGLVTYEDFWCAPTTPASWNIRVGPGRAIVDGSVNPWLQGSYICYAPDPRDIPVTPSTNQRRRDRVIIHVHDQDNSTEQGYSWDREVVAGTPGSNQLPPLPPNSLQIGTLDIAANSSAVTAVESFDTRKAAGALLYHYSNSQFQDFIWGAPGGAWNNFNLVDIPEGFPFPVLCEFDFMGRFSGNMDSNHQLNYYWLAPSGNQQFLVQNGVYVPAAEHRSAVLTSTFMYGPGQRIRGSMSHGSGYGTSNLEGGWKMNIRPAPAGSWLHGWQPPPNWQW